MRAIKIEKNIPIPLKRTNGKGVAYPFGELDIGDSFFVKGDDLVIRKVRGVAATQNRRGDKNYTVRQVGGGCRVWRIELEDRRR